MIAKKLESCTKTVSHNKSTQYRLYSLKTKFLTLNLWAFSRVFPQYCDHKMNHGYMNTRTLSYLLVIFFIFYRGIWRLGSEERHPTFQKYRDLFQKYQVHVRRMFDEFHIRPSDELNHFLRKWISSNVRLTLWTRYFFLDFLEHIDNFPANFGFFIQKSNKTL